MSLNGAFNISTLAMLAQSHAMENISQNIANVNSTGYKRTETPFKTMLAKSTAQFDFFGVKTADRSLIDRPGGIANTGNSLDLAINGNGLFILNSSSGGNGGTVYSRNGTFETHQEGSDIYLKLGDNYLMGQAPGSTALTPISIKLNETDAAGNYIGRTIAGSATSTASLTANVDTIATDVQKLSFNVFDPQGGRQAVVLEMTPVPGSLNNWTMKVTAGATGATNVVSTPLQFDTTGKLVSPTSLAVTADWGVDGSSSFNLDLTKLTSFAGSTALESSTVDGTAPGSLTSYGFNARGELVGQYSNGVNEVMYRVPVAIFASPNMLQLKSGTVFAETVDSGAPSLRLIGETGSSQTFVAGAVEQSNVDLAQEFTNMIMSQKAYSSAATVFRTADEMTQTAGDLKR